MNYLIEPYTVQVLVIGPAGHFKSRFAAGFPKPILVMLFDPGAKAKPYLSYGDYTVAGTPWKAIPGCPAIEMDFAYKRGVGTTDGKANPDTLVATVEYYEDQFVFTIDPVTQLRVYTVKPHAYDAFERRLKSLSTKELRAAEGYKTIVLDSWTHMNYSQLELQRYLNPTKSIKQLFDLNWAQAISLQDAATVHGRLARWRQTNTVVIAHEADKDFVKEGEKVKKGINAYGKIKSDFGTSFMEIYHAVTDEGGENVVFNTKPSGGFVGASSIMAPHPMRPEYDAMWGLAEPEERGGS